MAAWGEGPFENDTATEYVRELVELDPDDVDSTLNTTLEDVLDTRVRSDADAWRRAVAAAAVIACQLDDNLGMDSPIATWLEDEPVEATDDLQELAEKVLARATQEGALHDEWEQRGLLEDVQGELEPYQRVLAA